MPQLFEILKQLCLINGVSGDEDRVAEFITEKINPQNAVIRRDSMGNVLVFKKGRQDTAKKSVMFCAHMDEVGFIVTDITDDGFLRFATVGGIDVSAVFGKRVVFGKNGVNGVIAGKPTHLLSGEKKNSLPKMTELFIDIGAADKSQAKSLVEPGDYCCFVGDYHEFGNGRICSKAIDDRAGCAVMLDILKDTPEYDCVLAFTVQEEIGCRGAAAAAFNLEPDICIVLEATSACDTAKVPDEETVCKLGAGAVIGFMDRSSVYDRELYSIAVKTAKENNNKVQTKNMIVGGNDAGVIHKSMGGIRTIAVSVPCRYIHTPLCVADKNDIVEVRKLAELLLCKFAVM